jgi:hypothetical protein
MLGNPMDSCQDFKGDIVYVNDKVVIPWATTYHTKLIVTNVEEISTLGFRCKCPDGYFWFFPSQVSKL